MLKEYAANLSAMLSEFEEAWVGVDENGSSFLAKHKTMADGNYLYITRNYTAYTVYESGSTDVAFVGVERQLLHWLSAWFDDMKEPLT